MQSTDLGDAFMTIARELRHRQARALEPFDLNPSEGRALRMIAKNQPCRLGDLAGWLRVVPRSATDVADALETSGLITRSADPGDRRATLLGLTDAGTDRLRQLEQARRKEANGFFDRLTADQQRQLQAILADLSSPPATPARPAPA